MCSWKQASGDEVLYVRPDAVFDKVSNQQREMHQADQPLQRLLCRRHTNTSICWEVCYKITFMAKRYSLHLYWLRCS